MHVLRQLRLAHGPHLSQLRRRAGAPPPPVATARRCLTLHHPASPAGSQPSPTRLATSATLHCLLGCWLGMAGALGAGFLAAWPVNDVLAQRGVARAHTC